MTIHLANPLQDDEVSADYPQRPLRTPAARQWSARSSIGINEEHRHSAIGFVTLHSATRAWTLRSQQTVELYEAARESTRALEWRTRNWQPVMIVHLNPEKPATQKLTGRSNTWNSNGPHKCNIQATTRLKFSAEGEPEGQQHVR